MSASRLRSCLTMRMYDTNLSTGAATCAAPPRLRIPLRRTFKLDWNLKPLHYLFIMHLSILARLFFVLCLSLANATAVFAEKNSKPNVIFILVDDLGWGDLGFLHQNDRAAAGKPAIKTPQLDILAKEGTSLTHHYCPAPVCAPSRASFLTGVTQGHAHVRDNQFDKALENNHTVASIMRQAGYATCAIGKWGLTGDLRRSPAHPLKRGFDDFFGCLRHIDGHEHYLKENPVKAYHNTHTRVMLFDGHREITDQLDKCYTTDLFTAKAKHWIAQHRQKKADQPFFMYLAYDTPHAVLQLPTGPYPKGGGLHGGLQWLGKPGHMINSATGEIDSYTHPDCSHADWPAVYQRYATSVRRLDDAVGDIIQLLKDLHIDQETLVVFTSDNGPETASYLLDPKHPGRHLPFAPEFFASYGPFSGIKRDCWEGGVRVPTLVRWPNHVKANAEVTRPSSFPDWMPTFANLAGYPAPARTDGTSLLPELTGNGTALPEKPIYIEYAVGGNTPGYKDFPRNLRGRPRNQMQMIRMGDKVGVRYNIRNAEDPFEIYDAVNDPKESNNLAAKKEHASLQQAMKAAALQMRRPNPSAPRPYDNTPVPPVYAVKKLTPGLHCQVFANPAPWLPDTSTLTPLRQWITPTPDLAPAKLSAHEAVTFSGFLKIPRDGEYSFSLSGKGRAFLRLHLASVIDADHRRLNHASTGKIHLKAGLHPILLSYAQDPKQAAALHLEWSGPELPQQAIPAAALFHQK